ncbi:MAG: heme-copper oxidase subunit III [Flavobacteriaceae bacterium]
MDLTQSSEKVKGDRAKKMMLWFGMVSLIMAFAGWTSAYIVSSSREDWMADLEIPNAFYISTLLIIISSLTYAIAKRAVQKDNKPLAMMWLLVTLVLGITFISLQFYGFQNIIASGYNFTGPTSNIKMSYVFLIAFVHILHVVAGLISLLVVIYNTSKNRYTPTEYLGVSLGATFWHFLDLLWVYLILFMTFVK